MLELVGFRHAADHLHSGQPQIGAMPAGEPVGGFHAGRGKIEHTAAADFSPDIEVFSGQGAGPGEGEQHDLLLGGFSHCQN